jgi:hypothetical protein
MLDDFESVEAGHINYEAFYDRRSLSGQRLRMKSRVSPFPIVEEKVSRIPGIPTLHESEAEYDECTSVSSQEKRDSHASARRAKELLEVSEGQAARENHILAIEGGDHINGHRIDSSLSKMKKQEITPKINRQPSFTALHFQTISLPQTRVPKQQSSPL